MTKEAGFTGKYASGGTPTPGPWRVETYTKGNTKEAEAIRADRGILVVLPDVGICGQ